MILSKTDCMAMQRQVSTCQIDQIFIGFCLTMHDICDTHTLIINYTLLVFYNFFLYMISQDKIMTECDSNHWLSQGASFGHLSSKPWMRNTSAIFCFKIKPFFITHPDICWKLSVYSEFQDHVDCVHNKGPQSCVPSTWCTL